jgi:hypothetical protein
MITAAILYDSLLVLRDNKGNQIGSISLNGGEFLGYSSNFIVLRYGNMIITRDEKDRQLGNLPLPSVYVITGITNSGFMARTGSLLQSYDMHCNHIGSQNI